MNTRQGTVKGEMQGKKRDVEEMKVSATAVLRGKLGELAARGHWMAGLAPRCCCVFPARQAGHQSFSTLLPAVVPWLQFPAGPGTRKVPFGTVPSLPPQVWLSTEGSPMSHIERCDFSEERDNLESLEYSSFDKRR